MRSVLEWGSASSLRRKDRKLEVKGRDLVLSERPIELLRPACWGRLGPETRDGCLEEAAFELHFK